MPLSNAKTAYKRYLDHLRTELDNTEIKLVAAGIDDLAMDAAGRGDRELVPDIHQVICNELHLSYQHCILLANRDDVIDRIVEAVKEMGYTVQRYTNTALGARITVSGWAA